MNVKSVKSVSGIAEYARVYFPDDNPVKFLDVLLRDAVDTAPYPHGQEPYLFGSSDPLMASVDGNGELAAIEIQSFPTGRCDSGIVDYIRGKNPESVRVIVSDDKESPPPFVFKGDENGAVLRFSNHADENVLYRIKADVFLGFDLSGVLSEFIYLGDKLGRELNQK